MAKTNFKIVGVESRQEAYTWQFKIILWNIWNKYPIFFHSYNRDKHFTTETYFHNGS